MMPWSLLYGEAVSNLQRWRTRYLANDYPHMIVKNMMYEAYTMREIFREYQNRSLPSYTRIEDALSYLKTYHVEVRKYRICPRFELMLKDNPKDSIGGLIYANYEKMAYSAEVSEDMLEQIEHSYIFDFLQEKCVQRWLALCLSGLSEMDAVRMITGATGPIRYLDGSILNDSNPLDFGLVRTLFQDLGVNTFMEAHYQPLPPLPSGIETRKKMSNDELVDKINEEIIGYTQENATFFNHTKQYDDSKMLARFSRDFRYANSNGLSERVVIEESDVFNNYVCSCPHPFVCAELTSALITKGDYSTATIFLQEVLQNAFSVSNPYWNNPIAICGCADALMMLYDILGDKNISEFEMLTSVSVRRALQLYLIRAKAALDIISDEDQEKYRLTSRKQKYSSEISPGVLANVNMLYEGYKRGEFSIQKNLLAELMLFVRLYSTKHSLSFREHIANRAIQAAERREQLPLSYKKEYTPLDKRLMSFFEKKENYQRFEEYLDSKGVKYLYHITLRANLQSIIENKGLYSWEYSLNNDIKFDAAIGNEETREKDAKAGLGNYVRMSFCDDYPTQKERKRKGEDLVLLKIKRDAIWSWDTRFSDCDATDPAHHDGPNFEDLKRIDIDAALRHGLETDDPRYNSHLAEVMVKEYVPISYILNIDNPDTF